MKSYTRGGQTTLFDYDPIGNITLNEEMGSGQYVYLGETRPHAVFGANGRMYDYDEAGNMIFRNGQTLAYDAQNCLRQVDFVFYLYNDACERVRKICMAGETVWIDDIYEREPGRTLCHVQAGGKRIVTFSADGSEFYYYHSDHLGSSSLMTDQDGSLVRQQYGYRAFGSERFALSFSPSFTSRFTGQPFDADTGLYYYQSRYYDPELGRFIQPDSIVPNPGSSQSLNRYSYVLNNPLKYIDPTGHFEQPTSFFGGSGTLGFGSGRNWIGVGWGAGGFLGAGFGRDWLGLGWQAGGFGTMASHSSVTDPYALWDALADSPSVISGYDKLSFFDKWKYQRPRALEDTLKTAASVSTLTLPFGPPARGAAVVGFFAPTTRLTQVAAKGAAQAERGGLNLFKWNHSTSTKAIGWRTGDYFLHLPNQGSARANWIQNSSSLRAEMGKAKPIFDSYRDPRSGAQIPSGQTPTSGGRFLRAERELLEHHGWRYNPKTGAYHPPE